MNVAENVPVRDAALYRNLAARENGRKRRSTEFEGKARPVIAPLQTRIYIALKIYTKGGRKEMMRRKERWGEKGGE